MKVTHLMCPCELPLNYLARILARANFGVAKCYVTHINLKMVLKKHPMSKEKLWKTFRKPGELLLNPTETLAAYTNFRINKTKYFEGFDLKFSHLIKSSFHVQFHICCCQERWSPHGLCRKCVTEVNKLWIYKTFPLPPHTHTHTHTCALLSSNWRSRSIQPHTCMHNKKVQLWNSPDEYSPTSSQSSKHVNTCKQSSHKTA